jgi:hypothetical protein
MNIKGTFFVTAKAVMVEAFGEERWNSFMTKLSGKDKYFSKVIMAITLIPVEKLIVFLTRCVRNSSTTTKCST